MVEDFNDSGINLPENKRKRVIELNRDIGRLAKEARSNIDEDKSRIEVRFKDLENLQRDQVAKLEKSDKEGYVWLPLKSSQMDSSLSLSDDEEFRKKMRTAKDS